MDGQMYGYDRWIDRPFLKYTSRIQGPGVVAGDAFQGVN